MDNEEDRTAFDEQSKTHFNSESSNYRSHPALSHQDARSLDDKAVDSRILDYLSRVLPETDENSQNPARALVPWMCDVLRSEHSLKGYLRDLAHFTRHLGVFGVAPLAATADHVRLYKGALLKAGMRPTTVARRLTVLRGAYRELAIHGFIPWEVANGISSIQAPPVAKNTTPALTTKQAIEMLEAISTDTLQGIRDLAMLQTFFVTGCRVSAITGACVGHLEFDGVEHYLHVTEKRDKKTRKILLDATRPLLTYLDAAGIRDDSEGPLFRPLCRNRQGFERRRLDRKTPWRLVKHYCRQAGINPNRLGARGVGIHSLRKTAITDAIRNGAQMHEVRQFAGHADIRTTELYFVRRDDDAERAARRIQIRPKISD